MRIVPFILAFLPSLAVADTATFPMVNGEEEPGWDAVVALGADLGGGPFSACTGTLITPRIVLTAAHCGGDLPLDLVVLLGRAFVGPDVDHMRYELELSELYPHEDYVELQNTPNGPTGPENDVSVMVLTQDAPDDVAPVWFRTEALDEDAVEDTPLTSVGFGTTSADGGGGGVKRSAVLNIEAFSSQFIISANGTNENEANICSGDSGGPMIRLDDEGQPKVWAVHSWSDPDCLVRSGSTRTDLLADWILDRVEDVHGSRDRCVAWDAYDDGVCDADCFEPDPDCEVPEPAGDDDDDDGADAGCEQPGCGGGGVAWLAAVAPLGRRRRG